MLPDLRRYDTTRVVDRAQRQLDTRFDRSSEVRKRRSLGFRTDRDTWVRLEIRGLARMDGQGWGIEEAAAIDGVAMPAWQQGLSWVDRELGVRWRADEIDQVADVPVKPGGTLTVEPELPETWWTTLNSSLDALTRHTTTRFATSAGSRLTQERIAAPVRGAFPDIDTTITEWSTAHADLGWANLTAPTCHILDWEDWGLAPRGYDAATLWAASLMLPDLADRVHQERRADLDSRSGLLMRLHHCTALIAAGERYGPLSTPAAERVDELVSALRA